MTRGHIIACLCTLTIVAGCATDGPQPVGASYHSELQRTDAAIAQLTSRSDARPGDWLVQQQLGWALLGRARLSGSYADYAHATKAVEQAFSLAAKGSGPWLLKAQLDYTLHRFSAVESSLQAAERAVMVSSSKRAAIATLRGDLAFQRGDYVVAKANYEGAVAKARTAGNLFRLALYRWRVGEHATADALFLEAERRNHSATAVDRAWYHLQRGLIDLDRGRYAAALRHYKDGAGFVSGWWLLEEHMAEALANLGRTDEAVALYRTVVNKTNSPELMDALASLTNDDALAARAKKGFEERIAQFPEASYGHAFDYFLSTDPGRALGLARRDVTQRPGAPAHIALAKAYLRNGRARAAWKALATPLAGPWRSADLFATAAVAKARLGKQADAADFSSRATAINPDAMDVAQELSAL